MDLFARTTNWLLTAPIQIQHGPQRGGILGWIGESGRTAFVYGEITGYYLTWLAFIRSISDNSKLIRLKATAASHWIAARFRNGGTPDTRHHLLPGEEDWRNRLWFSFDLAMMLRGVLSAETLCPGSSVPSCNISHLNSRLLKFKDSRQTLRPVLKRSAGDSAFPSRWSTLPGPFQLKTAAAIISVKNSFISSELNIAAENTHQRWKGFYDARPLNGDLHPIFYAIEGLLLTGHYAEAAAIYTAVMEHQRENGRLPACIGNSTPPGRSDVLAQALRAGVILKSLGFLAEPFWEKRLQGLYRQLVCFISDEGAVSFFRKAENGERYWNVWCTLFTCQALYFYDCLLSQKTPADEHIAGKWIETLI